MLITSTKHEGAAYVSLPFKMRLSKNADTQMPSARIARCFRLRLPVEHLPAQTEKLSHSMRRLQVLSFTLERSAM